jgi:hypothetical protein
MCTTWIPRFQVGAISPKAPLAISGEFLDLQSSKNMLVLLKGEVERCIVRIEMGHVSVVPKFVASHAKVSRAEPKTKLLGKAVYFICRRV